MNLPGHTTFPPASLLLRFLDAGVPVEAPEGEDARDPDALFLEELRVAEA